MTTSAIAKPPDIASAPVPDAGLKQAYVDVRRKEHGYNEVADDHSRPP
jgi:hypothetical protein